MIGFEASNARGLDRLTKDSLCERRGGGIIVLSSREDVVNYGTISACGSATDFNALYRCTGGSVSIATVGIFVNYGIIQSVPSGNIHIECREFRNFGVIQPSPIITIGDILSNAKSILLTPSYSAVTRFLWKVKTSPFELNRTSAALNLSVLGEQKLWFPLIAAHPHLNAKANYRGKTVAQRLVEELSMKSMGICSVKNLIQLNGSELFMSNVMRVPQWVRDSLAYCVFGLSFDGEMLNDHFRFSNISLFRIFLTMPSLERTKVTLWVKENDNDDREMSEFVAATSLTHNEPFSKYDIKDEECINIDRYIKVIPFAEDTGVGGFIQIRCDSGLNIGCGGLIVADQCGLAAAVEQFADRNPLQFGCHLKFKNRVSKMELQRQKLRHELQAQIQALKRLFDILFGDCDFASPNESVEAKEESERREQEIKSKFADFEPSTARELDRLTKELQSRSARMEQMEEEQRSTAERAEKSKAENQELLNDVSCSKRENVAIEQEHAQRSLTNVHREILDANYTLTAAESAYRTQIEFLEHDLQEMNGNIDQKLTDLTSKYEQRIRLLTEELENHIVSELRRCHHVKGLVHSLGQYEQCQYVLNEANIIQFDWHSITRNFQHLVEVRDLFSSHRNEQIRHYFREQIPCSFGIDCKAMTDYCSNAPNTAIPSLCAVTIDTLSSIHSYLLHSGNNINLMDQEHSSKISGVVSIKRQLTRQHSIETTQNSQWREQDLKRKLVDFEASMRRGGGIISCCAGKRLAARMRGW